MKNKVFVAHMWLAISDFQTVISRRESLLQIVVKKSSDERKENICHDILDIHVNYTSKRKQSEFKEENGKEYLMY